MEIGRIQWMTVAALALTCGLAMAGAQAAPAPATTQPAAPRASSARPHVQRASQPVGRPAGSQPAAMAPESRSVGGGASANRQDVEGGRVGRGGGSLFGGWIQTLVALAIVAALIFATRAVLRRLSPGGRSPVKPSGAVRVLAQTPLSPRHQLYVIAWGRRLVLAATCGDRLTTVSQITDADEMADVLAEVAGDTAVGSKLTRSLGLRRGRQQGGGEP